MKMIPPQIEVGLMKIMPWWNRSWIEDCSMPRLPLAQMLAPKRPGAQTSCSGNRQLAIRYHLLLQSTMLHKNFWVAANPNFNRQFSPFNNHWFIDSVNVPFPVNHSTFIIWSQQESKGLVDKMLGPNVLLSAYINVVIQSSMYIKKTCTCRGVQANDAYPPPYFSQIYKFPLFSFFIVFLSSP